jgi:molybdopterin-guanine dinucleotide biosynthesis protein A
MKVYGLILAGGMGSRLGNVRKGDLRVGGERLLSRLSREIKNSTDSLYVATGTGAAPQLNVGVGIPDIAPKEGPMGGLRAFLHHAQPDSDSIVVTTSVDSPFLPPRYVEALIDALGSQAVAVISHWRGQAYPTHAAWRVTALNRVADHNSPRRALEDLNAQILDWSSETANPFANINDFSELLAAQRRSLGWGKDK